MLVTTFSSIIAVMVFLTAMILVTVLDLRTRRIPNWLLILLAAAYPPLAWFAGFDPVHMATSLGAAALTFAAGLYLFARGWVGGGDVKLAAVVVMWLGAALALPYLLLTSVFGGLFALAGLFGLWLAARRSGDGARPVETRMPYGPGMACAGLLVLQVSPWMSML